MYSGGNLCTCCLEETHRYHEFDDLRSCLLRSRCFPASASCSSTTMRRYSRLLADSLIALPALIRTLYPALLLWFIYARVYSFWFDQVGRGAWGPAWPVGRTRLVISMVALPLWGACMTCWRVLGRVKRRILPGALREKYAGVIGVDIEGKFEGKAVARSRRSGWSKWGADMAAYVFVVLGIFLLSTYECVGDARYRPLIRQAARKPRPAGYHNGGIFF